MGDWDGAVDMQEFLEYLFPNRPGMTDYERVLAFFRQCDHNMNGMIDRREFGALMRTLYPQYPANQFDALFQAADKDHSGEVDSNELIAYIFGVPQDRKEQAKALERKNDRESR